MKNILNKIYNMAKVLAVFLVIIAALGLLYVEFVKDSDINPLSSVNSAYESLSYDGVGSKTNSIDSYDAVETTDQSSDDKIAYKARLSLVTYNFDQAVEETNNIIKENDVKLINDNYEIYNSERSNYFHLTVRSSELDNIVEQLKNLGNVITYDKDAMNITDRYTNLEKRVSSLESQLERMYSLLDEADSVSDLTNIYSEIDYLESQLDYLRERLYDTDKEIEYSDLYLTITDAHKYNENGMLVDSESFLDNLVYSLGDTWVVFVNFLFGAMIVAVYIFPFLLTLGVIYLIYWYLNKKRPNNKAQNQKDTREETGSEG